MVERAPSRHPVHDPGAGRAGQCCGAFAEVARKLVAEVRPCYSLPHDYFVGSCPARSDYAFPSGHATVAAGTVAAVFLLDRRLAAIAAVFALLEGFTRVYVGAHYPHDVIGAALLALPVAYLTSLVQGRIAVPAGTRLRAGALRPVPTAAPALASHPDRQLRPLRDRRGCLWRGHQACDLRSHRRAPPRAEGASHGIPRKGFSPSVPRERGTPPVSPMPAPPVCPEDLTSLGRRPARGCPARSAPGSPARTACPSTTPCTTRSCTSAKSSGTGSGHPLVRHGRFINQTTPLQREHGTGGLWVARGGSRVGPHRWRIPAEPSPAGWLPPRPKSTYGWV